MIDCEVRVHQDLLNDTSSRRMWRPPSLTVRSLAMASSPRQRPPGSNISLCAECLGGLAATPGQGPGFCQRKLSGSGFPSATTTLSQRSYSSIPASMAGLATGQSGTLTVASMESWAAHRPTQNSSGPLVGVASIPSWAVAAERSYTTSSGVSSPFGTGFNPPSAVLATGSCGEYGTDVDKDCPTKACGPAAYADSVDLDKSCDGKCDETDIDEPLYSDLILLAWCVLNENLDIVADALEAYGYAGRYDWLVNMITGEYRLGRICIEVGECAKKSYNAEAGSITLADKLAWGATSALLAAAELGIVALLPIIIPLLMVAAPYSVVRLYYYLTTIRIQEDWLCEVVNDVWKNTTQHPDNTKRTMCVATSLAGTIFHELCHLAFIAFGEWDFMPDHHDAHKLGNYFKYYAMKRYCVLGYGCCNFEDDGMGNWELFVCDEKQRGIRHSIDDRDMKCG